MEKKNKISFCIPNCQLVKACYSLDQVMHKREKHAEFQRTYLPVNTSLLHLQCVWLVKKIYRKHIKFILFFIFVLVWKIIRKMKNSGNGANKVCKKKKKKFRCVLFSIFCKYLHTQICFRVMVREIVFPYRSEYVPHWIFYICQFITD